MDDKEDFLGGSPNNTTYVNNVGRGGRANMMGSIVRQRNSRRVSLEHLFIFQSYYQTRSLMNYNHL